jgi:predicted TPR repeat methyltransferase
VSSGAAETAYARAVASWHAHRLADAERACREALRLRPHFPAATALLAEVVLAAGDGRLAAMLAERAYADAPGDARLRQLLGRALIDAGQRDEAMCVLAEGDFARVATRLAAAGRLDDARALVEHGLGLRPDDPELRHLGVAFAGAALDRAPDAYLVAHFDAFAPTFDERLVGIGYSLPALVPAALARALGGRRTAILDAGCGTGLLAPGLRPLATRLVGVDLSPGMLSRARAREEYDALAEAELIGWLAATEERFGAVVGADLLIYVGAVEALLAGFARVLESAGVVVLSIEVGGRGSHALETSGRFSHDPGYLDAALAAAGLEPVAHERCDLRVQSGAPVQGMVVTARRDGA